MSAETVTQAVTVTNRHGLHARPAVVIAKTVRKYDAQVTIHRGNQAADATSILDLLSLGATQGTKLLLSAKGPQAQQVINALTRNLTPNSRLTTRTSPHFSPACRVRAANRWENGGLRTKSNPWIHVRPFWTGSRNAP